jgi:hypothetical protein
MITTVVLVLHRLAMGVHPSDGEMTTNFRSSLL